MGAAGWDDFSSTQPLLPSCSPGWGPAAPPSSLPVGSHSLSLTPGAGVGIVRLCPVDLLGSPFPPRAGHVGPVLLGQPWQVPAGGAGIKAAEAVLAGARPSGGRGQPLHPAATSRGCSSRPAEPVAGTCPRAERSEDPSSTATVALVHLPLDSGTGLLKLGSQYIFVVLKMSFKPP